MNGERELKRWIKRKMTFTVSLLVTFLITGLISYGADADVEALKKQVADLSSKIASLEKNQIKYFSVNSTGGVNEKNDGAAKTDAIAIGKDAKGYVTGSVAMGRDAYVATVGKHGDNVGNGGIAIGQSAHSRVNVVGNHESSVAFNHKDNKYNMVGGIAIGQESHARIGSVDIGNRDFRGEIGDINFDGKTLTSHNTIDAVGATTVGTNSFNGGNFSTITGSYNLISRRPEKTGFFSSISNAQRGTQGLGSVIVGSLNSIENNFDSGFKSSGMASSVVGVANKVNKSNGALILGAGNEITNSYIELNEDPQKQYSSIKELSDTFRKVSTDNRLGSVGIIGGANKVDNAVLSTVIGVGNTLKGKENSSLNETLKTGEVKDFGGLSAFNMISGYENEITNTDFVTAQGIKNKVENTDKTIVIGNNAVLKGTEDDKATGNIIIGNNDEKKEDRFKASSKDIVAIGSNTQTGGNEAIAIGKGAQALADKTISIGSGNVVSGQNSGAIGDPSTVSGQGSYSIGNNNNISKDNTFVLGSNVKEDIENSVYLGKDSTMIETAGKNKDKDMKEGATTTAGATGTVTEAKIGETGKEVTYNGFAGGTSVGGITVGASGAERRIMNVAAGEISKTSTDAINGSQLYAVAENINNNIEANKIHYFSVKSDKNEDNYNNDGAKANGSIAIGPKAKALKANSVSLGEGATSEKSYSISVGPEAKTDGIGAIAIGQRNTSKGNFALSMGLDSVANGKNSMAIGMDSKAGENVVAIGANTNAEKATFAQAIGTSAVLTELKDGENDIVAGKKITVNNQNSANGSGTSVEKLDITEKDDEVLRKEHGNLYLSMAVGTKASAHDLGATAIGAFSTATHKHSIALGNSSQALNEYAIAIGDNAVSTASNSIALGRNSEALEKDTKDGKAVFSNEDVKKKTGVLSVGNKTDKRRIINVAGGIDGNDAVNVMQLKAATIGNNDLYEDKKDGANNPVDEKGNPLVKDEDGKYYPKGENGKPDKSNGPVEPARQIKGLKFVGNDNIAEYRRVLGDEVKILGNASNVDKKADFSDKNVLTENAADGVHIKISDKPEFKSVTLNDGKKPAVLTSDDKGNLLINGNPIATSSDVAASKIKYFSVKSDDKGNSNNDGATGVGAIAIGPEAVSNKKLSLALGNTAKATNDFAVAMGTKATASGYAGVATGAHTNVLADYSNAYGIKATVDETGYAATAIGAYSYVGKVDKDHSIANKPTAWSGKEVAAGTTVNPETEVNVEDNTKPDAGSERGSSIAIGYDSQALSNNAVVLGSAGQVSGSNGTAIGTASRVYGNNGIAMGSQAYSVGNHGIAMGTFSGAYADQTIALGNRAQATGEGSIALGQWSNVEKAKNSIALGNNSNVLEKDTKDGKAVFSNEDVKKEAGVVSFGTTAYKAKFNNGEKTFEEANRRLIHVAGGIDDNDAVNVMQLKAAKTEVTGTGAAIVTEAKAEDGHSIYNVHVDKPVQFTTADGIPVTKDSDGKFYELKDGKPDKAKEVNVKNIIVSMVNPDGTSTTPTKLGNVAEGDISENSKDAVNGSQIHKLKNDLTNNINASKTEVKSTDGSVAITSTNAEDGHNIYDLSVKKSELKVSDDGKTITSDDNNKNGFVTGDNVATVVNKALLSARTEVQNGKNTTVEKETAKDGHDIYKVNVEGDLEDIKSISNGSTKVSLDKDGVSVNGSKITNVKAGEADTDAVNVKQLNDKVGEINKNVIASKTEVTGTGAAVVVENKAEDGHSIYNVHVDKPVQFTKADGTPVTKDSDGKFYELKDGKPDKTKEVEPADVIVSMVNPDGTSTTPTKLNNVAPAKISDDSTEAVNGSQLKDLADKVGIKPNENGKFEAPKFNKLKDEKGNDVTAENPTVVSTVNNTIDTVNKGLDFAGNAGNGKQQLGSKVSIVGSEKAKDSKYSSNNITTTYKQNEGNGTITIEMKENPTFAGDVTSKTGVKVENGPSMTTNGIDAANKKITNVAAGTDDNDAVNLGQLKKISGNVNNIGNQLTEIGGRVGDLEAGLASTAAVANIPQVASDRRFGIGVGVASYKDKQAIAVGVSGHNKSRNVVYKVSGSIDTNKNLVLGAGINYSFGGSDIIDNIDEINKLKDKLEKLENKMQAVESTPKDRELLFIIDNFRLDGSEISKPNADKIKEVVEELNKNYKDRIIDIIGYTDTHAGDKYNLSLGLRRANAVANLMKEYGLDESFVIRRIESQGYNQVKNGSYGQHRRVEIIVK